jgi:hypothetical protein
MSFRVATEPSEARFYASPNAVNVRGPDAFGRRLRGGSRPGFSSYGVPQGLTADIYNVPTAFYRGRKIYAEGSLWYASRVGDFNDFDMSGDGDDLTRPAMGKVGRAARADGERITAIFSIDESALFISTEGSLWVCRDDLTTGAFSRVVPYAGAVSKDAWSYDGTRFYFVSSDSVYAYTLSEGAMRISDAIPREFRGITSALCQYDPNDSALYIFTDKGDWVFEIETKAWWPMSFSDDKIRPLLGCIIGTQARFYCKDGRWRSFGCDESKDDDVPVESSIVIGPIRCSSREDADGLFDSLSTAMASGSLEVNIELYGGKTAEDAVLSAENQKEILWRGLVSGGYSNIRYPRIRSPWVCIRLHSNATWAFESMTVVTKSLGVLR